MTETKIGREPLETGSKAYNEILEGTLNRYKLLKEPLQDLQELLNDFDERDGKLFRLAATDVFVEKAQYHLTKRGVVNYSIAAFCLLLTIVIAILFLLWVSGIFPHDAQFFNYLDIPTGPLILLILQKLAITSVFLAGIYLTASFGRAFLHEGTILFSRRHSLRFGRLYVYLCDGKISSDDLFKAFGWNIVQTTAFSKVRPEFVTKGIVSQLGDALEKTAKSAAELASVRRN